jgi:predicted regulator of Ras-like GTPase activity (Roadblock/LC7/MglB family)
VKSTLDTDITEEFTARMAYLLGKLDKFAKKLDGTQVVGLTVETENTEIILIREDTTFMSVLLAK